jgi:hypothetical protein
VDVLSSRCYLGGLSRPPPQPSAGVGAREPPRPVARAPDVLPPSWSLVPTVVVDVLHVLQRVVLPGPAPGEGQAPPQEPAPLPQRVPRSARLPQWVPRSAPLLLPVLDETPPTRRTLPSPQSKGKERNPRR